MGEDVLSNILSKLGAGSKPTVYLSVTPGVGLEICQIDIQTKTVKSYAYRKLDYNEMSREIANYGQFKNAVTELFEELNINPKCNVVLNLPLVYFGTKDLPLMLDDVAISTAITSEVEQTYIFRRLEPLVAWQDAYSANSDSDNRRVLYSAIQQLVIDNIKEALTSLGANLIDIEISISSYLRALDFAELATAQMQDNVTWNLLIVSATGYSLVSLVGKNVIDYYEEPLAFKSFEGDAIYNEIINSAQITLMSYPANYLYIISETDQVSAELLATRIPGAVNIDFFENNSYRKHEILATSLDVLSENKLTISLGAIGCALANTWDYPLSLKFLDKKTVTENDFTEPELINFGNTSFEISPKVALNIASIAFAIIVIPLVIFSFLLLPKIEANLKEKLDDTKVKYQEVSAQLKKYEGNELQDSGFEIKKEVKSVISSNRSKLMNYVALGDSIPNTVWLTYFMTQDNGLMDVKGSATNVEDIYIFYKNMKDSLINTRLRLQKLDVQSGSVDALISAPSSTSYDFEITNMDEGQLSAMLNGTSETTDETDNANGTNAAYGKNTAPLKSSKSGKNGFDNGLLGNTPVDIK